MKADTKTQPTEALGLESQHPLAKFLLRRYTELLAVLGILFVLQTGLVPYDFIGDAIKPGSIGLFSADAFRQSIPDTISNIFLYVPLGMLLHWALSATLRSRLVAWLLTIAIAAVLSFGVEWAQAYSPERVSSLVDLIANVIGGVIGASLSWIVRLTLPQLLSGALFVVRDRPRGALLRGYCLALVVFAAMPFSLSFDAGQIKKAVKSSNFVPFRTSTNDAALAADALDHGDLVAHAYLKWRLMKRWSRWAVEAASFMLLVWLLQSVLRGEYKFSRGAATLLIFWVGCGLAVGLSALQFLVVSRACDVTDVLFRLVGVVIGLITRSLYLGHGASWFPGLQDRQIRRLLKFACVFVAAYIVYNGALPLTFDAGAAGPAESLQSSSFLPFFGYFDTRFDVMMDDVMEKFSCYAVLALCLALSLSSAVSLPVQPRMWTILAVGVAISVAIEAVQMFITVRVSSLTDPILAVAGCFVGVLTIQQMAVFQHFAKTVPAPAVEQQIPGRLAPADALVASLTDAHPDAPVEMPPTPRPTRRS